MTPTTLRIALASHINPEEFTAPSYATDGSAGLDIYAQCDFTLSTEGPVFLDLGFHAQVPEGYAAMILPRSGLGSKFGLAFANTIGLIDSDYRGEWKLMAYLNRGGKNTSDLERSLEQMPKPNVTLDVCKGDHYAQVVFVKVERLHPEIVALEDLTQTARGTGGYGHTSSNSNHKL